MKPDFRGYPNDMDEEYTETTMDYNEKKTELTLNREEEVCKDKIDCKETMKTLIVRALTAMHPGNPSINFDCISICEKPDINV